jgi:hypothetical protein
MAFQKNLPAEAGHECIPSASTGQLENMDAPPSARKADAYKIHEKAGSISNTCERPWPVRGDMAMGLSTKLRLGRTAPVWSAESSGCASSWLLPPIAR